jgi:hypothetical protein
MPETRNVQRHKNFRQVLLNARSNERIRHMRSGTIVSVIKHANAFESGVLRDIASGETVRFGRAALTGSGFPISGPAVGAEVRWEPGTDMSNVGRLWPA